MGQVFDVYIYFILCVAPGLCNTQVPEKQVPRLEIPIIKIWNDTKRDAKNKDGYWRGI